MHQPSLSILFTFLETVLQCITPVAESAEFIMRFQQLTGPAMAKGIEDTAFYCYNRLIALNEVGGDPGRFGLSIQAFHDGCANTQAQWPTTMLSSSTHDTKRSEDVRARMVILSEIPESWAAAVRMWSAMNERHRHADLPDRNSEYFFYQTLFGAWPLSVERAVVCMQKAAREAKQHTSWDEPNKNYESALSSFITATLNDPQFQQELEMFIEPLVDMGYINSLALTLVKLTSPGIPDLYAGNELWDFSLVDPDNRRPVDFAIRKRFLAELEGCDANSVWRRIRDGLPKMWIIQKILQFRRRNPSCFGPEGAYSPINSEGTKQNHVVAFGRAHERIKAIAVVPRLIFGLLGSHRQWDCGIDVWQNTCLKLPGDFAGREYRNLFTGELIPSSQQIALSRILTRFPIALLVAS
jgi:(1->4)-alpha-D-glucan 1-alpha-D-glucosylmutase